jgi:prepilin-type N-terminal cleavage/methylation domain-containing protein
MTNPCSAVKGVPRRQRGFTFVEMAIVLVIAGLLSWASFSAYETVNARQDRNQAKAMAREMQAHLRTFSMRHGRLPCPDSSPTGSGYEGLTGSACSPGNQVGWFPYVSLGMVVPIEALRTRYAVLRAANAVPGSDADLAVTMERTGDQIDHVNYQDVTDLMMALNNANGLALDSTQAYLTGDSAMAGAFDCVTHQVMNVAYWLVVPLEDRSGDSNRLDPPHAINSLCAFSPSAPTRDNNDDVVLAESPTQLAGWIRKSLP